MQGVAFLLAICVAAALVAAVAVMVRWSRLSDERAGYYGRAVQQRHQQAADDSSTIAAILARSDRDALAAITVELDRLAFAGVPLERVVPHGDESWVLAFRDGTQLQVHAHDARALRRAGELARRAALVVAVVHPLDDAVVVQLRTPHHEPLRVALSI